MKKLSEKQLHRIFPEWAAIFYASACGFLIPWVIYLDTVLPRRYVSNHWDIVWAGFDAFECLLFALTAFCVIKRSIWSAFFSVMLGTTLLIDAWFDLLTARSVRDFRTAIFTAMFLEIPIAIISFILGLRVMSLLKKM